LRSNCDTSASPSSWEEREQREGGREGDREDEEGGAVLSCTGSEGTESLKQEQFDAKTGTLGR
jgi:hypothetical protein